MKSRPSQPTPATYMMRNPHLLVLTVVILLVGGYSALQSMPRLEDPIITNRNTLIITQLPGASAERVEAQITEKIENALKEVPEIKEVDSTSRAGISVIAIGLADEVTRRTNREIFSRIRDKLDDAVREFPADALEPVFDDKRGASAFSLIAGLTWAADGPLPLTLLTRHAENLADALRNVPGTDIVRIYGAPTEQVLVAVDPAEMSDLGLTIEGIAAALTAADVKVPAGALNGSRRDFLVEVAGELDTIGRVSRVPVITGAAGDIVRLADIARVSRSVVEPPVEMARSGQRRAIYVAARVLETRRVDTWSRLARQTIADFSGAIDPAIGVHTVFDQNAYTSARLGELAFNLLLGGVVILIVIFCVMGWRASWIVGTALPLTAAMTLFLVALTGGKLHQMSIFGMIIALGLLIDNAIVVTDEVIKHRRQGKSGSASVSSALKHLSTPLLSSTLTTVLAFAPILLLPGNAGDFVSAIGGSVIIALVSSFFIAMTVIASLAGLFGGHSKRQAQRRRWYTSGVRIEWLSQAFGRILQTAFRRPLVTVILAAVIPLAGFKAASTLGVQFFPRTDRNMFELQLWMPTATNIYHTAAITRAIEDRLRRHDGITEVHWLHGGSFPSVYYNLIMNKDRSSHYAQAIVEATDFNTVKQLIPLIQADADRHFPQAQIVITQFAQGPPSEADVEFRVVGPNIRQLQNIGDTIRLVLAEHPDILHTQVSMPRGEPKVWFQASEEEVHLAGLRLTHLARQMQGNLQGLVGGTVIEDVEELPVRIRYADSLRRTFDDLRTTRFVAGANPSSWIPLNALGDLDLRAASGGITRRNGQRVNIIRGYTQNEALPIEVTRFVRDALEKAAFTLPAGYSLQVGGDQENQSEAVGNLMLYLPVLSIMTAAILILSFKSVVIAMILGTVALLSAGVGLLATWAADLPLSFNTILGSLGLVGLAFNSSIVVLAAIHTKEAARLGDPKAMAQQVMGSARHLMSTTLTTIGSFMPLLIFIGGDFWPPLAVVLAGGVGGATILAMVFTPSAYGLMTRLRPWASRRTTAASQHNPVG
ncbi:MAG: efflux RND transporter permease subunit [Desulfosarcinaceae bacterium]|nr:efflux RND transporter permease subunit [Desulfosarcinaceae bacterium]